MSNIEILAKEINKISKSEKVDYEYIVENLINSINKDKKVKLIC